MTWRTHLARLRGDRSGATAIEFALLGPLLFTLLLGILQFGLAMQAYNAMRSASADVARFAVVERQKGNAVTATALSTKARTTAVASPYKLLNANLSNAVVTVATTQRVTGATEYKLQYNYNVPNFLEIIDLPTIPLMYSRPIFVVT